MSDYNIFEIIKKEKMNLNNANTEHITKIFCKYYFKFMLLIESKIDNIHDINFYNDIDKIGSMLFHISWVIILTTFNIHITIFFMERATLLFSEFIILSSKEPNYKLETDTKIHDAIVFTYKKTIGSSTLEDLLKETNYKNNLLYQDIINTRKSCNIITKIVNKLIFIKNDISIEDFNYFQNNTKYLIIPLYKIYQIIDIDKYIIHKVNKYLKYENIEIGLFLFRINIGILQDYLNEYFFNNLDDNIEYFLDYVDEILINKEKKIQETKIRTYNYDNIRKYLLYKEIKILIFRLFE
jgi:hypothetical protein